MNVKTYTTTAVDPTTTPMDRGVEARKYIF
jgi:hypothetical protein